MWKKYASQEVISKSIPISTFSLIYTLSNLLSNAGINENICLVRRLLQMRNNTAVTMARAECTQIMNCNHIDDVRNGIHNLFYYLLQKV